MKLRLIFLLSLCGIFSYSFCQVKSHMLFNYEDNIENPAKVIQSSHIFREINYQYNLKKYNNTDSSGISVRFYDTTGYIIEQQNYEGGILRSKTLYRYYTDNTIYTIVENNIFLNTTYTTLYQYDSVGREVYKYYFNKDTTKLTIEQKEYDNKGQVIRLRTKIDSAQFYLNEQYEYNEDGKLIKTVTLNDKGEIRHSDIIEYEPGKETYYSEDEGEKVKKKEAYFNDKGQLIKVVIPSRYVNISGPNGYAVFDQNAITENFIYNTDGTLFELKASNGNQKQLYRRYYYQK